MNPLDSVAQAAAGIGAASAQVNLPPLPARCLSDTPHTALIEGEELAVLLRRERGQLDLANSNRADCARFYARLRADLADGGEGK